MNIDEFIRNFADSIEGVQAEAVRPETVMRDLPQWDSLAVLTTLAMIDAEYEVSVSANELAAQQTLADLFNLVKARHDG